MDNPTYHQTVWFEIPVTDLTRAIRFYEQVLSIDICEQAMDEIMLGLFPHDDKNSVSGALIYGMGLKPSSDGSIVYLNGGDDLGVTLSKVEGAGGKVLIPKTHLGDEIGYIGHFIDSEGNRIGLHSIQ